MLLWEMMLGQGDQTSHALMLELIRTDKNLKGVTDVGDEITLTNVGPIEGEFSLELNGPGLYELRGSKGTGKTTVLESLSLVAGHKSYLTVHDGELRGSVKAFGMDAPIGSRKKRTGELEVETLDSERFDLVDLIDPQGKTPHVRDAVRIKTLATMQGLRLTPKHFEAILSKQEIDELGVEQTEDPVLFSNRLKRALDAAAKRLETQAKTTVGRVSQLRDSVEGVDVEKESDPQVLGDAHAAAAAKQAELTGQVELAQQDAAARSKAEKELKEAKARSTDPLDELKTHLVDCEGAVAAQEVEIERLKDQLTQALTLKGELQLEVTRAESKVSGAEELERVITSWQDVLNGERVELPSAEELAEASDRVVESRQAIEDGTLIRKAQESLQEADKLAEQVSALEKQAKSTRAAAGRIFDVLTQNLGTKEIKIEAIDGHPRLVVDHPKRHKTFFDHIDGLSDGERVQYAIHELLPYLKSPGLFPVPQRTYQDMPPEDRRELARVAEEKELYVFGAQVSDGDLRCEKLEGSDGEVEQ